jgi:hypothetical protein
MLADEVNIGNDTVKKIVVEDLRKRKICSRFVLLDSKAERPENCSLHATIVKQLLAQRKVNVLDHPPYLPDLAPADYFLFLKVKSHLKGRLFDFISDIQKSVTSTLDTLQRTTSIKVSISYVTMEIYVYS